MGMSKRKKIFLTVSGILTVFVLCSVSFAVGQGFENSNNTQVAAQIPLDADTIYRLVNDERMKAGLQPLLRDVRLDATAQARADDMVARNYFAHYDPVTGENLAKIIPTNPECKAASENISWNTPPNTADDAKNIVISWMNSKPHHDAILLPEYTLTGVAVSKDKIVQHFCISK